MDDIVDRINYIVGANWSTKYTDDIPNQEPVKPGVPFNRYKDEVPPQEPVKPKKRHWLNRYTGEGLQPWMLGYKEDI
jgi:hypothetical protein